MKDYVIEIKKDSFKLTSGIKLFNAQTKIQQSIEDLVTNGIKFADSTRFKPNNATSDLKYHLANLDIRVGNYKK